MSLKGRTKGKITTRIGTYDVPLKNRFATIVTFGAGARGKHEAGDYAFWAAVLKTPKKMPSYRRKSTRIFGRAVVGLSAGDRFDRMLGEAADRSFSKSDRDVYKNMFYLLMERGKNVKFVRSATDKEVRRWMSTHQTDAKFAARYMSYRGKRVRI